MVSAPGSVAEEKLDALSSVFGKEDVVPPVGAMAKIDAAEAFDKVNVAPESGVVTSVPAARASKSSIVARATPGCSRHPPNMAISTSAIEARESAPASVALSVESECIGSFRLSQENLIYVPMPDV